MATLAFPFSSSLNLTSSACPRRRPSKASLCTTRGAAGGGGDGDKPPLFLDRRDILLGLGGLYGATTAVPSPAMSRPVAPPDLSKCKPATSEGIETGSDLLKCCPPYQSIPTITDYAFPKTPLRVRRPAHIAAADKEYVDKLQSAFAAMKSLPADDPWNFVQQAKIHCAYCNDGYDQVDPAFDGSKVPLQVHGSWLFLPWHRYYVHFYERVLGKLIGDDTFALPYWNWDNPEGMAFPAALLNDPKMAALYNPARNQDHVSTGAVVDYLFTYDNDRANIPKEQIVKENLEDMRSAFKNSLPLAELFMGDPLRAGEQADVDHAAGRLENIHNSVHMWVGPVESPHTDMGNFATAAKDVSFWALHCNVDRLWNLYRSLRGNQVEFNEPDWLDATFIFYDEDRKLVRVKLRDTLTSAKFCYTYEDSPTPWLGKAGKKKRGLGKKTTEELISVSDFGKEPRRLTEGEVRVVVERPKKGRSKDEKEEQVEVLFVEGIVANTAAAARFDVYVSRLVDGKAERGDLVGSYVKLLHSGKGKKKGKPAQLKLGLTAALEDLGADHDEKVVVTLRPRVGDVTIGGLSIRLLDTDSLA